VARWRAAGPERIEPPAWYRTFGPAAWDAMDADEKRMFDSCPSARPWPEDLHRWHAERRWCEAKHAYRKDHPALAEQEFEEIVNSKAQARMEE
jgi:hypothetical protein